MVAVVRPFSDHPESVHLDHIAGADTALWGLTHPVGSPANPVGLSTKNIASVHGFITEIPRQGGGRVSIVAWLGVVSAIISIVAFLFAVWVWIWKDRKAQELEAIIQSAYNIAGDILWDTQLVVPEDAATRLRNVENALGKVAGLRETTARYAKSPSSFRATEIGTLLERGVIWTNAMVYQFERSKQVREVWLITPDLQPDLSSTTTGEIVASNLKNRKRYVYFCPSDLRNLEADMKRLLANIGALKSPEASRVTVVAVGPEVAEGIFQRGNTIIFFLGDPEWATFNAFEEIVLTKVSERGIFWQEHKPEVATDIRDILKQVLQRWREAHSS